MCGGADQEELRAVVEKNTNPKKQETKKKQIKRYKRQKIQITRNKRQNSKRQETKKEMGNLLFFGNFHKMKLEDYEWGMNEMMKDKDFLYGSLIRDIYYLGVVLGRKYRQLRIAYSVFMFGFVISVLAFVIAML